MSDQIQNLQATLSAKDKQLGRGEGIFLAMSLFVEEAFGDEAQQRRFIQRLSQAFDEALTDRQETGAC